MTAQLNTAITALKRQFASEIASGEITHLGTYNCRTKNNKPGGPWSEHAWPNAVDVMLKVKDGQVGDEVAAWMRSRPDLWSEVFWKILAHHDHVHGTAAPRRNYDNNQIPPCAGGDDDMAFSQHEIGQLQDLVRGLDKMKSTGYGLATGGVDLIRRERANPLHKPESDGGDLTPDQIAAILNGGEWVFSP